MKNVPESGCRFTGLFRQFEKPLFVLALKMTKSAPVASDIIQDVFLKLWELGDEIDQIGDMSAWLHRSTRNRVIDILRKTAADERLRANLWNQLATNTHDTETIIEGREYSRLMEKAVAALPTKRREIYRLRREDGLNYEEISDKLSISQHTVKNQMSGALRSIQRFVTGTIGSLLIIFFL